MMPRTSFGVNADRRHRRSAWGCMEPPETTATRKEQRLEAKRARRTRTSPRTRAVRRFLKKRQNELFFEDGSSDTSASDDSAAPGISATPLSSTAVTSLAADDAPVMADESVAKTSDQLHEETTFVTTNAGSIDSKLPLTSTDSTITLTAVGSPGPSTPPASTSAAWTKTEPLLSTPCFVRLSQASTSYSPLPPELPVIPRKTSTSHMRAREKGMLWQVWSR